MNNKGNTNDFINKSLLEARAINKATMENAKINILEEINPKLDKLIKESLQEAEGDDDDNEDVVDDTTAASNDSTEDTSTDDSGSAEDDTESVEDTMEDITDDSEEIFSEGDDDDSEDVIATDDTDADADFDDNDDADFDDDDYSDDYSDDDEDLEEDIKLYGNEHDLQSEDIDNDVQDDDIDDTDDSLTDDSDNVVDDEDMDDDLKEILNIGENKKSTTKKFIKVEVAKYKNLVNENKKLKLGFTKVNSILKETTLLNSKLIYATKLFSKNSLNKQQKIKVVEKLDRAKSIKDVKLIYNSLNEGLSINKPQLSNSKKAIVEGLKGAKANVENAKQRKVLIESKNSIIPEDVKANFNRFAFYNPSK